MTKSEFARQAGKANVYPEIYGMIINCSFKCGAIPSGCKVDGIEWHDGWETRSEYSMYIGTHDVTSLKSQPYIVLKKNRKKYVVEAWRVQGYVVDKMRKQFFDAVKANNNTI